ncbi:MAG: hypothetical protein KDK66_08955, partial [Deltaproteobacteria bacterium]|nr:hypothetical protein [Deltaproteobacteria bacterium]
MFRVFFVFIFSFFSFFFSGALLKAEPGFWILQEGQKSDEERQVETKVKEVQEVCLQADLPKSKWLILEASFEEAQGSNLLFSITWTPQDYDKSQDCYRIKWKVPTTLPKGAYQIADLR